MVCIFFIQSVVSWSVSFVPLAKLRDEQYNHFIRDTLARDGVLFVTDIPHFAQASKDAFTAFDKCEERTLATTNSQGVFNAFVPRRLSNESVRTADSFPEPRSSCDMHVAHTFRALVHQTGADVARALGPRAVDFMKTGAHREQFHRYRSSDDQLPVHTDAGVLLAMASKVTNDEYVNALTIVTPLGDTVDVPIPRDSILIMAGESFNIAHELLGVPLRAIPHAPVIPQMDSSTSRLWYGEMYLPSEDFYIRPNLKMRDWLNAPDAATIGCLTGDRRLKDARVDCGPDSSLCWMQCIPKNVTCRNVTSGGTCDSAASRMHPECQATQHFCANGMPTNMFMQGFVSLLFGSSNNGCLVFFFEGWAINSYWKFALAFCAYTVLGVASEALIYYRRRAARQSSQSRALQLLSYAANVALGYIVMLGAMTYAVEIFLAIVFGLTLGQALFGFDQGGRISAITACCARGGVGEPARGVPLVSVDVSGSLPTERRDYHDEGPLSNPLMERLILHVEGHEGRASAVEDTISGIDGVTQCVGDCCDPNRLVVHTNGNVSMESIRDVLAEINVRCRLPI